MTTPVDLLAKFEKYWNTFLDDVKASFKREYLPSSGELSELRATPENAPYLLIEVVGKPLLPHALAIAANVGDFLRDVSPELHFKGIRVSEMYRDPETSVATREALGKYVTAFYIMATSAPASIAEALREKQAQAQTGGKSTESEGGVPSFELPFLGQEMGKLMTELTAELMGKQEVRTALESAIKSSTMENFQKNPLSLITELSREGSELGEAVKVMGKTIEEKLTKDTEFARTVEQSVPKMMEGMLGQMGKLGQSNLAAGMPDLTKMMGGLFGGGGNQNPFDLLSGLVGAKKEDDAMPDLDDIERDVRKKSQKDFREAMQRELLRKKLEQRRNAKQNKNEK
jgi:hypothetical protein